MTGARFQELKRGAQPANEQEAKEYADTLAWERRSQAAHRAVATKRRRYTKWPTRANDHQRKGR